MGRLVAAGKVVSWGLACLVLVPPAALAPAYAAGLSASSTPPSALAPLQPGLDYHSFANIEQFRISRIELDLRVDAKNKVLLGAAGLEIKRLDPRATDLVLDTRDLDVREVSEKATSLLGATAKDQTTWVSRPFHFERSDPILGSPLVIELPPLARKSSELIRIEYVTSPTSDRLAWLGAGDSGAKHDPLFFTLSGPIAARSWIPLQDTPQVRFTLRAHIHTDEDALALMSAKNDPHAKRNGDYLFEMSEPLCAPALALAVGNLRFRELGPRSGLFAERALLGAGSESLAALEKLIAAGESLAGPYPFGRADLLLLPSRYPFAGRAQPRLGYLNASTLADPETALASAARVLAAAWTEHLIAPSSWRDAWIGEGLAGYLGRRLEAAVLGESRARLEEAIALRTLPGELAALPPEAQRLAVDLRAQDPSQVPAARAAKATLLFEWLEARAGRERLESFLRVLFDRFGQKSLTTEAFLDELERSLLTGAAAQAARAELRTWIEAPGLPPDALSSVAPASAADVGSVDAVRTAWLAGTPLRKLDTRSWHTDEWCDFLEGLPASLDRAQLADLDAMPALGHGAAVVTRDWLERVIAAGDTPAYPRLEAFLAEQGRPELIVPLYRQLMQMPAGTALARRVYGEARAHYLAPTSQVLDPIVSPGDMNDE